jgi:hypothetical protein
MSYLVKLWRFDYHHYREETIYVHYTPPIPSKKTKTAGISTLEKLKEWCKTCLTKLTGESNVMLKGSTNLSKIDSPVVLPAITKRKRMTKSVRI